METAPLFAASTDSKLPESSLNVAWQVSDSSGRESTIAHPGQGARRVVEVPRNAEWRSEAEREFARALEEYKRKSGRNFPTWSEVLEVLNSLGYRRDQREVAR